MPRMITLAAAQTGPVNQDDWRPNVAGACKMIEEAGRRKVDILSFSELFLTPFFPNRLTKDYDKFFVTLDEPELQPIFKAAVDARVALLFPFGEKNGRHYHNSCLVTDKAGKRLGIYRKTHIPAILPSNLPGGTGSYEKFYFSPGTDFPVFDLCGTRIGIQICYDRKYPEGSRLLALKGAEILFMPICAARSAMAPTAASTFCSRTGAAPPATSRSRMSISCVAPGSQSFRILSRHAARGISRRLPTWLPPAHGR